MHDKTIRRRRAVLAALVVISLILLTDYFGESSNSPLHSVQRGVVEVLSPLQDGASKVLSPVRDVAGYISSTLRAKSELAQYKRDNEALQNDLASTQYGGTQRQREQKLQEYESGHNLTRYHPVTAELEGFDPSLWYQTIELNKGSDAGVHVNDPVVSAAGVVGDVSHLGSNYSVVELLTAPNFAVGATVVNEAEDTSILKPSLGSPETLVLGPLQPTAQVSVNEEVVTSGFKDPGHPTVQSKFPGGLLIGKISTLDAQNSVYSSGTVEVKPAADLLHLSVVSILTDPHG